MAADRLWSDRGLAEELPPDTTLAYLGRSAGLAGASVLLTLGARRWADRSLGVPREDRRSSEDWFAAAAGVGVAIASATLVLVHPATLTRLAKEDSVVEWGSALLCFLAAGLTVAAALGHRRTDSSSGNGRTTALLLVIGAIFAILGLEEVSWFQRVFDVESPSIFIDRNGQKETNLHNFATTATGNLFFVGGFLACIAAPLLLAGRALPDRWSWLRPLAPPTTILYGTVTAAAVVYEMWNVLWIQLTFWLSVPAIVLVGTDASRRRLGAILAVVTLAVAAVFVLGGGSMERSWDDTEVRELIVTYGLALYGFSPVADEQGPLRPPTMCAPCTFSRRRQHW